MSMFIITSGKKDSFISRLYRAKVTEIFYLFDKYLCGFFAPYVLLYDEIRTFF